MTCGPDACAILKSVLVCNAVCGVITFTIIVIAVLDLLTWLQYIFSGMTYGQR